MPYKNKEEERAAARKRWRENPEVRRKHDECQKRWNEANREKLLAYRAQWAKENRAKRLIVYKRYERRKLLAQYGLEPDWFEKQTALQGGVCAICKKPETRVHHLGSLMSLAVDHDHRTGKVRGLLCCACNMNLHRVEDSGWLTKATEYLKGFEGETI